MSVSVPDPDQLVPNYIILNPDGTIGANFTGHVSASGVDLTAATTFSNPPAQNNSLRWLRQSDNKLVAYELGYESGSQDALYLVSTPDGTTKDGFIALESIRNNDSTVSGLSVKQGKIGNSSVLSLFAGYLNGVSGYLLKLLDDSGNSGFIQVPDRANGTPGNLSWGVVSGNGTAITAGTNDWNVNRTSTGVYVLTWTNKPHGTPAVFATVIETGNGAICRCLTIPSNNGVTIGVITTANVADDNDFCFIALG